MASPGAIPSKGDAILARHHRPKPSVFSRPGSLKSCRKTSSPVSRFLTELTIFWRRSGGPWPLLLLIVQCLARSGGLFGDLFFCRSNEDLFSRRTFAATQRLIGHSNFRDVRYQLRIREFRYRPIRIVGI